MYDTLARIEEEIANIELEYLRKTYTATRPKLLERATAIEAIPDFWPTVIDEAPTEIDQRIQPRDVPALNCLTGIDVERFEVLDADNGEARSIKLTFSFKPNEWFHDETIEKKLHWRMSKNGWSGLVGEPVRVHWRDRDLTEGLLDMAFNLWQKEKELEVSRSCTQQQIKTLILHTQQARGQNRDDIGATDEFKLLVEKVERTPQDAISIFGLFGFRGHHISAQESLSAMDGKNGMVEGAKSGVEGPEKGLPALPGTEIYPHGEEVAVAFGEDLYPGATQYFTAAKERDTKISEEELVSDSDNSQSSDDANDENHAGRPHKKPRTYS
ncbi:MAG: hypothetical protein Q9216_000904 [Gyalolechia sp. 2 TL-2023]